MRFSFGVAFVSLALATPTLAVTLDPGNFVILNTAADPLAGASLFRTVNSIPLGVDNPQQANLTQPFLQATISLTTNAYVTAAGNVGLAYTINNQSFTDPSTPFNFTSVRIPSLAIPGFGTFATDVAVSRIPTGFSTTNPSIVAVRSADGNTITFQFNDFAIPITNLIAGSGPITLFVQTSATNAAAALSTMRLETVDNRNPVQAGSFIEEMDTLAPHTGALGVPEPLSLLTLPLAITAIWFRRRWGT